MARATETELVAWRLLGGNHIVLCKLVDPPGMALRRGRQAGGWRQYVASDPFAHKYARPRDPTEKVRTSIIVFSVDTDQDLSANKFSTRFSGASVLSQATEGHCALSAASLCTAKHVRKYYQTGELPKNGTLCDVDHGTFDDEEDEKADATMTEEDKALLQTLRRLRAVGRDRTHWLGV